MTFSQDDFAAFSEEINEKVATAGELYEPLLSLPREQAIDGLRDMLRVIATVEAIARRKLSWVWQEQ